MKYCCGEMKQMHSNAHVNIFGSGYFIQILHSGILVDKEVCGYQLEYCFFCGENLEDK